MRKSVIVLLSGTTMILIAVGAIVLLHGFPFALMDLNDDGSISPAEYLQSIDLWYRPVDGRDEHCTEIYQLKDGLPIKMLCKDG